MTAVTPLRIRKPDPTAAVRAQHYRERQRHAAVTARHATSLVRIAVTLGALALASVSAGFAIMGLTAIFRGAEWSVVAMGAAMELGKLTAVAWLGCRPVAPMVLKIGIALLVGALMGLNALGCYGFLARAHLDHAVAGEVAIGINADDVNGKLQVQAAVVADLDQRVGQVDAAVAEAVRRGRAIGAMALVEQQKRYRTNLISEKLIEARKLAALQVEAAAVTGERARIAADSGPVHYIAALVGAADEAVMRIFILALGCLLDPLAVALLLAATVGGTP